MPRTVEYDEVLAAATAAGLRCVYPNGAAFAPLDDWHVAGWVSGEDATIRPTFRDRARRADDLPALVAAAWRTHFAQAAEAWVAPVHHWAAELEHGAGESVAAAFACDVPRGRRADAVAFGSADELAVVLGRLFGAMTKADFTLLLPPCRVVVTLHHHRQVWWRCADRGVADALLDPRG